MIPTFERRVVNFTMMNDLAVLRLFQQYFSHTRVMRHSDYHGCHFDPDRISSLVGFEPSPLIQS